MTDKELMKKHLAVHEAVQALAKVGDSEVFFGRVSRHKGRTKLIIDVTEFEGKALNFWVIEEINRKETSQLKNG